MIFEHFNGESVRMVEVATFEGDSITVKRPGFLGISNGKTFRAELWPPAKYTGAIACNIGDFSKTMCILPSPSLFWSFREDGIVTVERIPMEKHPFGDVYCRNLGVDLESMRYSRTFWSINEKGVVAVSEKRLGQVSLRWTDDRPDESSVNTSNMALTFSINDVESTCVTCIAGVGDDILSLPVTECRTIRPKNSYTQSENCDCNLYRFLAALCAMGLVSLLSTLIYSCISTMTSSSTHLSTSRCGKRRSNGNDSTHVISLRHLRRCSASLGD